MFEGAFLSTCCPARELALFQQSVDDAGSIDGRKQNLSVAQTAKDDSATVLSQNRQFELPMDCKNDVGMCSTPATPHDKDVMHKFRGAILEFRLWTCPENF